MKDTHPDAIRHWNALTRQWKKVWQSLFLNMETERVSVNDG